MAEAFNQIDFQSVRGLIESLYRFPFTMESVPLLFLVSHTRVAFHVNREPLSRHSSCLYLALFRTRVNKKYTNPRPKYQTIWGAETGRMPLNARRN
ncbi:MAG: hypothetical protein DWH80_00680 [Planctomycetota bacterium]|nr:MAG: hypothetical protein DWH80_00680 [Planctomycetota bacterium]